MCDALRTLYSHVSRSVIDSGVPKERIVARLEGRA